MKGTQEAQVKTKNNTKAILHCIAIILTVITMISLAIGLFAWSRYTATQSGNATASVAAWNFNLSLQSGSGSVSGGSQSLDLATTMYDHIAEGTIAPGTSGQFDIVIDTRGTEVSMYYDVNIAMTNCPRNITFSKKGPGESEFTVISAARTGNETERTRTVNFNKYLALSEIEDANENETTFVETIKWDWPYELTTGTNAEKEAYDDRDRADSGRTVTLGITATGTEVMNTPVMAATITNGSGNTINNGDTLKVFLGDTDKLNLSNGTEAVTYSSSSNAVATVGTDGTIITLTEGEATITIKGQETGTTANVNIDVKRATKYAVQIYGINQDVDADGNILGLTFGPAVGADYNNAYVTHTYEETSEGSGEYYVKIVTHTVASNGTETTSEDYLYKNGGTTDKVTRTQEQVTVRQNICLHDMTWTQIKAVQDKTVFEDCMLCGDTKSVKLALNSTIRTGAYLTPRGDGPGMIDGSIRGEYKKWNDSNNNTRNAGGYSSSRIRATLIGSNSKTNTTFAGTNVLDSTTCIYSCLESDLQDVITSKKIKYVTGTGTNSNRLNDDIADSIWLFSDREIFGTGEYSGTTKEGLDYSRVTNDTGVGYDKFANPESEYYVPSYNSDSNTNRVAYSSAATGWWTRSPHLNTIEYPLLIDNGGRISWTYATKQYGLAFGFCIK